MPSESKTALNADPSKESTVQIAPSLEHKANWVEQTDESHGRSNANSTVTSSPPSPVHVPDKPTDSLPGAIHSTPLQSSWICGICTESNAATSEICLSCGAPSGKLKQETTAGGASSFSPTPVVHATRNSQPSKLKSDPEEKTANRSRKIGFGSGITTVARGDGKDSARGGRRKRRK